MPDQGTKARAKRDARAGKAASTQAGEFVHDEIRKIRRGDHDARSTKQAIAIGLSQARRSGVSLPPPKKGASSADVRKHAKRDLKKGKTGAKPSPRRAKASLKALRRESGKAASPSALSRQTKEAARKRGPRARQGAARKAAQTRKRSAA